MSKFEKCDRYLDNFSVPVNVCDELQFLVESRS